MLKAGANIILQYPDPKGGYVCHPYGGFAIANPALIVFAGGETPTAAAALTGLALEVERQIQLAAPTVTQVDTGCGTHIPGPQGCHAHGENRCHKLLVIVGDEKQALFPASLYDWWTSKSSEYAILPIFPRTAQPNIGQLLPPSIAGINVSWWTGSILQAVPEVLKAARLTPESSRVFISYRQADSQALAIQLFEELAHFNFDVFLDHFRIDPGVDFQVRLTQELGDKTMVLVLESEHYKDSEWTTYELNVAKECRLGVFALQMPGGTPPHWWNMPGIYDDTRMKLTDTDFDGSHFSRDSKLTATKLGQVADRIRSEHGTAMVRRRWILRSSMFDALLKAGCQAHYYDGYGVLHVPSKAGSEYLVWVTERPPELQQFHVAYTNCQPPSTAVVVGLARLLEPARAERTNWLANLCHIGFIDEGHMSEAAELMVRGSL